MSNSAISLAKTTRPTLTMVINRERLFRKLDAGLDKKSVWIFGPPGSGKTTLMASYVESRDRASLWYQLDGNDADVASFFYYLRQTAIKLSRHSGDEIPKLPVSVENWKNYGRQLFREIYSVFNEPLTIIFDNYETIPPHSEIHDVFKQVIEEVPNDSLLVFISRTSPSPNLARSIANNWIVVIDGDDLRLNNEECIQIARIRKAEVATDTLEKIMQSTAGWITGSIIMLEYAKQTGQLEKRQFGSAGNILFDYLANEIFSGFDDTARKILLYVCWPRRLNAGLATTISGEDAAMPLLANLARNNYFVTERVDNQGHEYIIHPMLREFLQAKAREVLTEKTVNEVQHRTAGLLLKEGLTEEAVELLAANLDWETVEPVIVQHASLLVDQGRSDLLASWLEELPHDRLNRNPWLLFWYGIARQKHAPREARHYFETAFRKFRDAPVTDRQGMTLCCCGVIEVVLAEMDDISLLDNWITELIELNRGNPPIGELSHSRSADVLTLIALMVRRPDNDNINEWLTRVEASARNQSHMRDGSGDLVCLTLVYLLAGELDKARDKLELIQYLKDQGNPLRKCQYQLLSGLYHILRGDGESAYSEALNCLAIAEENSLSNLLPFIYACGSCAGLIKNDLDESGDWIDKLLSTDKSNRRLTRFMYHYIRSRQALINDDVINSHHEQRRALNYAVELGIPYFEVLSRTALGQLLYLCDDTRGVNAQLRRVHSIARDIKNPLLEFMTLLVYGDIAMNQGRTTTGINALRYALGLGRRQAYYHLPWWHSRELSHICAVALQNKIEIDYVREFILRRSLQPIPLSIEIPEWPWPFRVSTLGQTAIEKLDGTRMDSIKNDSRPMQLLMVLIAMGAKDVHLNEVAEVLWPHVDKEYGVKSLTINLHRLRRVFNNDDSILLKDGRLSLNDKLVWLDLWALERQIANIESTITTPGLVPSETGIKDLFDKMINAYKGAFLNEDEQYACFISTRNHYRAEFIRVINLLVDSIIEHDIPIDVPEFYNQCIQRDPLAEGIYRRLLLWYLDSNRHADAMDTYDRCCIALARSTQRTPSAEMQSIYNQLVKNSRPT